MARESRYALYRGEIRSLRLGGFLRLMVVSRGGVVHGALDCDGSDVLLLSLRWARSSAARLRLRRDETIGGEVEGAVSSRAPPSRPALDAGAAGDGSIGGLRTSHDILELGDDVEGGVPAVSPAVSPLWTWNGHGLPGSLRLAQLGGGGGRAGADRWRGPGSGVERDDADGSDDRGGTRGIARMAGDGFETSGGRDEKRGGVTVRRIPSRRCERDRTPRGTDGRRRRRAKTPIASPVGKKAHVGEHTRRRASRGRRGSPVR